MNISTSFSLAILLASLTALHAADPPHAPVAGDSGSAANPPRNPSIETLEPVAEPPDETRAVVTIDSGAPSVRYSPMIFGGFLEHFERQIYGGVFEPGSPLADARGFRRDALAALKELKVPIVRWPGGCYVSGYHRENGVGRMRKPTDDMAWGVVEPNTFGTDRKLGVRVHFLSFLFQKTANPFHAKKSPIADSPEPSMVKYPLKIQSNTSRRAGPLPAVIDRRYSRRFSSARWLQSLSSGGKIGLDFLPFLVFQSRTISHVLNDPFPLLDGIFGDRLEGMTRRAAHREQTASGYQFFKRIPRSLPHSCHRGSDLQRAFAEACTASDENPQTRQYMNENEP